MRELVADAMRRLGDYKLRAVLAMAGIGISTASMVLVGDVLETLKVSSVGALRDLGGRTVVITSKPGVVNGRQPTPITLSDADMNRTGIVGGLIPREDGAHGTTQQVLPRTA